MRLTLLLWDHWSAYKSLYTVFAHLHLCICPDTSSCMLSSRSFSTLQSGLQSDQHTTFLNTSDRVLYHINMSSFQLLLYPVSSDFIVRSFLLRNTLSIDNTQKSWVHSTLDSALHSCTVNFTTACLLTCTISILLGYIKVSFADIHMIGDHVIQVC